MKRPTFFKVIHTSLCVAIYAKMSKSRKFQTFAFAFISRANLKEGNIV